MLFLAEVLQAVKGKSTLPQNTVFTGVNTDSRTIKQGELFVALKGENFDGHDYCAKALALGAVGVLVDHPIDAELMDRTVVTGDTLRAYQTLAHAYRVKNQKLKVVAITGSNGKTSTKDLIAVCLAQKYKVMKTEANFNNEIGLPRTLLSITADTEIAVVEMGMRGLGQIRALKALAEPDVVVITNVGETHMELLGSMENIAKAKGEILENLTSENVAVLNADDFYVSAMKTSAKVVTYGIMKDSMLHANDIYNACSGMTFTYQSKLTGKLQAVELPLIGRHNVMNALAAVAVAEVFAVPDEAIAAALHNAALTEKRQEMMHYGSITVVNDAYNASPASMEAALDTLRCVVLSRPKGRAVAVLSDMLELGSLSRNAHIKVGTQAAEKGVRLLVTYGPESVYTSQEAQRLGVECYHCGCKEEAAVLLRKLLLEDDVVLFKGSHSMEVDKVIGLTFENK